RTAGPRRWPGWLTPGAAAVAVTGVSNASLGISRLILRPTQTGPVGSCRVVYEGPPLLCPLPLGPRPQGAGRAPHARGRNRDADLGTVAPPKRHAFFDWVAAAGDGRTFVLGASSLPRGPWDVTTPRPVKLYRLVLDRSGRPGHLARLPIPAETGITGLALSPDGSKLAVSLLPVPGQAGSKIEVFSLATRPGPPRVWPAPAPIGP